MKNLALLTGENLDLSGLKDAEQEFLKQLYEEIANYPDYFDLLRRVKGPGAYPLRGGRITPEIAASVLYRAAHDIVDRVGIEQGYLLSPDVDYSAIKMPEGDLLSLTEAAEFIGISRPATHQALREERLPGIRVGNAWIVRRADAEVFRDNRTSRTPGPSTSNHTAPPIKMAAKPSE